MSVIRPNAEYAMAQLDALLEKEGIRRDAFLDHTVGLFDEDYHLIATGSCFGKTLRCMAVDSAHQGEGLLNRIVSELISFQFQRGNPDLFLYTKCDKAPVFGDMGFYEVARAGGQAVFMENHRDGFSRYLDRLKAETAASGLSGKVHGAVALNANPFTLGHQYLLETAAAECDLLHMFIVSEDLSLVPLAARERLIREGSAHLRNLVYHQCGSYIISNATFPSYFLKSETDVITAHARLDIAVFVKIAQALGITRRFVGEEPFSQVTGIYNQVMVKGLSNAGIGVTVIPRKEIDGMAVSASAVRELLKAGDFDALRTLVPESTYRFFTSPEAAPVLERIRVTMDVTHY